MEHDSRTAGPHGASRAAGVENPVSLRSAFNNIFTMGVAVEPHQLQKNGTLVTEQYASLTAENCMKPGPIHPSEGVYDFTKADTIVEFARSNKLKMRGHCLVWHNQTAPWFFDAPDGKTASRDLLLERMQLHIQTVVSRYKNSVYCWDVVNEAVDDKSDVWLRDSPWLRGIGPDFVAQAFRFAHAADPKAKLFYNDYNETEQPKLSKIERLIKQLQDDGVPIHGMGMQGHYGPEWPNEKEIRTAIETYIALGMEIQITELDVSVYRWNHGPSAIQTLQPEMNAIQITRYERLFAIFRDYQKHISGITFWGLTDDASWLNNFPEKNRPNWPLLFDANGKAKDALYRIIRSPA